MADVEWNVPQEDHSNRQAKTKALEEIASSLDVSGATGLFPTSPPPPSDDDGSAQF